MLTLPLNRTRPAFTIIEVMVATTIIGIIAASAGLSFLKTRLNARNSQRKEVAQTYTKAVSSYAASSGTSFVTADARKDSCPIPPSSVHDPLPAATAASCVGADGRGFGMLNYAGGSVSVTETNLSSDLATLGFSNSALLSYGSGSESILSALKALGFISTISADPLAKLVNGTVAATDTDYLLVRCCKDGRQAIGSGGSLFAIWAKLESGGSANVSTPDANSQHLCGGPQVAPPTYGSPIGSVTGTANHYHYVFGGAQTPVSGTSGGIDTYDNSWFAVGNAPVQNLTSLSDSCDKNA